MTIANTYRFFITLPNGTQEQFYPSIEGMDWKDEKYKEECFFRKELDTELVIDDAELFRTLYALEKDRCRCNALPIRIDKNCCGEWTENYHKGIFAFVDGDWNPEKCKVAFKIRDRDEYSCLLKEWDKERNFLEIQDRVNLSTIYGEVVCLEEVLIGTFDSPHDIDEIYPIAVTNAPAGYSLYQIIIKNAGGSSTPMIRAFAVYCRQESTTEPPNASQWTYDGTIWHRPLITTTSALYDVATNSYTYNYINFESDNGITLKDFLEFYLSDCYDCIVSNFFNINPDGTAPNNPEYLCAVKDFHDIIVFQTFEIIAPLEDNAIISGSDQQQAGIKKFKDFWENLNKMIPLCMFVDQDTGCLRLEHCSYIEDRADGKIIDLTKEGFAECLLGKMNYSVDPLDIPNSETWKYKIESTSRDFAFSKIEYDPDCSSDNDDIKDEDITIECFSNDLARIYRNEDLKTDESEIGNITLVSTTNGVINSATGIDGVQVLNGQFSLTNLAKYNLRKRPQCNGIVNGVNTTFFSQAKNRTPESITVPLDCKIYDQIDPERDKVRTLLGDCDIVSMERKEPSCMVTFELRF